MRVYFNNDLTPCNGEKDGIETRVYMCNELNPASRLVDCEQSYPENSAEDHNNPKTWKLIPESCSDAEAYEHPEDGNSRVICGNAATGLNWFNEVPNPAPCR